jgi:hypothetical protein
LLGLRLTALLVACVQLCMQVFQCGLSWRMVLNKRADITAAFRNFVVEDVARMTPRDLEALMSNGAPLASCSGRAGRLSPSVCVAP